MSDNQLQAYDRFTQQYEAAYNAFKATYALRIAPPAREDYALRVSPPERVIVDADNVTTKRGLAAMTGGGLIVSASHTIPVFVHSTLGDAKDTVATLVAVIVSIAGFVMVEVGIIAYSFIRTRNHFAQHPDKPSNLNAWLKVGMGVTLAIAVIANVYGTLGTIARADSAELNIFIAVAVGLSAPVLAFISGDAYAVLTVQDRQRQRRADREYELRLAEYQRRIEEREGEYMQACRDWQDGLNNAWNTQKARWGVKVEAVSSVHPTLSNGQSNGQSNMPALPSASIAGHRKQPNASQIVRDYIDANPEALNLNPRELATALGVGKSTVNNVQREMKGGGV